MKMSGDILPEMALGLTGDIIADKGLIRPFLQVELESQGLALHTPLRSNITSHYSYNIS